MMNSETRIRLRITGQGKDIVTSILCRARPVPLIIQCMETEHRET